MTSADDLLREHLERQTSTFAPKTDEDVIASPPDPYTRGPNDDMGCVERLREQLRQEGENQ